MQIKFLLLLLLLLSFVCLLKKTLVEGQVATASNLSTLDQLSYRIKDKNVSCLNY